MQRQVHWLLIDHEWIPQWEEIRSRLQRSFRQPAGPATGCHKCFIMFRWVCYWFTVKYFWTLSFFFYYLTIFYLLSSYTKSKITWLDQSGPLYWTPQKTLTCLYTSSQLCRLYWIFHLTWCGSAASHVYSIALDLLSQLSSFLSFSAHMVWFLFLSIGPLLWVWKSLCFMYVLQMKKPSTNPFVLPIHLWHLRPTCTLCPLESRDSFILCLIFLNIHLTGNSKRERNHENIFVTTAEILF